MRQIVEPSHQLVPCDRHFTAVITMLCDTAIFIIFVARTSACLDIAQFNALIHGADSIVLLLFFCTSRK